MKKQTYRLIVSWDYASNKSFIFKTDKIYIDSCNIITPDEMTYELRLVIANVVKHEGLTLESILKEDGIEFTIEPVEIIEV